MAFHRSILKHRRISLAGYEHISGTSVSGCSLDFQLPVQNLFCNVKVNDYRTGAEMWMQAGYNGGVPISHEFFIRQMSGKLNYVIADELMPEMEEKMRVEMMDEKEARYRK